MSEAWVTLATNDDYAQGALVVAHSLRTVGTTRKTHCLITNQVSEPVRKELENHFDDVTIVDVFNSRDAENLALLGRPDLGVTFTKLHCWRLAQYTKAVFLDADTLVIQNCDELFERPDFSAAADIGWPDCFNSGVFVFTPNRDTYRKLVAFATTHGSFDGGDQGILNEFFSNWRDLPSVHRLPFIYNMTAGAFYTYASAYKRYGSGTKIVHFIGAQKPWHGSAALHTGEHYRLWSNLYSTHVANTAKSAKKSAKPHGEKAKKSRLPLRKDSSSGGLLSVVVDAVHATFLPNPLDAAVLKAVSNEDPNTSQQEPHPQFDDEEDSEELDVHDQTNSAEEDSDSSKSGACHVYDSPSPVSDSQKEQDAAPSIDERREAWESGNPDYLGRDAFKNIKAALDEALRQ
ncbi:unnamed protein product [Caenorhabditis auriculariae]|uniref:glycogenin glucosyltransferase n=1 Tax=Caenorhabditis auriculariae TaxID=2777116 RepID=A0A8S1H528_9PELO|nr:unnamed protein product [Caenorhabditis auriculariae]